MEPVAASPTELSVDIRSLERPHKRLLWLYAARTLLSGPAMFIVGPVLFFRYETLKYRFDDEGVSMSWGILFRHEVHLAYSRIQDIHLQSGILQRWLGLADLYVQTASGSASAEMVIEGLLEVEAVRNWLYTRMRGVADEPGARGAASATPDAAENDAALIAALHGVRVELEATRAALEAARTGGR